MRTVTLDDDLLIEAEAEAERQSVTLPALVEAALREKLAQTRPALSGAPFELPVCQVPSDKWGLQLGLTWDELAYLDDDRGAAPW